MYILLITIIAWILLNPVSKTPKKLCNSLQISTFTKKIDKYHWYFHSYLNLKEYNKLEQSLAALSCNLATQYKQVRIVNLTPKIMEIYMIGINK